MNKDVVILHLTIKLLFNRNKKSTLNNYKNIRRSRSNVSFMLCDPGRVQLLLFTDDRILEVNNFERTCIVGHACQTVRVNLPCTPQNIQDFCD